MPDPMQHLVLFGPPGSGKGTQAALLVEAIGAHHLSTGRLLREAMAAESALGQEVRDHIGAGELVPDQTVNALVRDTLRGLPRSTPAVLFDGYPRSMNQAEALDASLTEILGHGVDLVLMLDIDDGEVIRRLAGRRECADCGAIYNIHTIGAMDPTGCRRCGGELVQRSDDHPEAIRHRLFVYKRQTRPLLDHYAALGLLTRIDGRRPPEVIHEAMLRAISRAPHARERA